GASLKPVRSLVKQERPDHLLTTASPRARPSRARPLARASLRAHTAANSRCQTGAVILSTTASLWRAAARRARWPRGRGKYRGKFGESSGKAVDTLRTRVIKSREPMVESQPARRRRGPP